MEGGREEEERDAAGPLPRRGALTTSAWGTIAPWPTLACDVTSLLSAAPILLASGAARLPFPFR